MLHNITDFFPAGTQLATPAGLHFDPDNVGAVESRGHLPQRKLLVFWKGGGCTELSFHRCVDGSPAEVDHICKSIIYHVNATRVSKR
jgi:hypothetical protein